MILKSIMDIAKKIPSLESFIASIDFSDSFRVENHS